MYDVQARVEHGGQPLHFRLLLDALRTALPLDLGDTRRYAGSEDKDYSLAKLWLHARDTSKLGQQALILSLKYYSVQRKVVHSR